MLQCVAVCCSVLQCVQHRSTSISLTAPYVGCSALMQCVAACVLMQCVAVCCSVLQCVAVCCSVGAKCCLAMQVQVLFILGGVSLHQCGEHSVIFP